MSDSNLFDFIGKKIKNSIHYLDFLLSDSDEEFVLVVDKILSDVIFEIEKNKKNFKNLDEDGLSAIITVALNTAGVLATRETHSNGHVDITISKLDYGQIKQILVEAKIWDGVQYHIKGLKQLLLRYATGRESRGIVLSYVKHKGIKDIFDKLKKHMNEERPCNQNQDCKDHILKWSFLSNHDHSSGEDIEVCHVGCNLYVEDKALKS